MVHNRNYKLVTLLLIYFIIGIIIIASYPSEVDSILKSNYIIDTLAYFFMTGMFISVFVRSGMNFFDPIVFISIIYITMFFIMPLIDISTGEVFWFGVNLFEHGIKGTIIAIIGYIAFLVGYIIKLKKNINKTINNKIIITFNNNKIVNICCIIWSVSLLFSLMYLKLSDGLSLAYILTLGKSGEVDISNVLSTPLGALSMFSYSLIPTCLIYNNYGKSKKMKFIFFFFTLMIQLIRGFRFIAIILLVSYFYFYYIKKNKMPSIKILFLGIVILILLIGLMGYYRFGIRTGTNVDWNEFNFTQIKNAVLDNFRIYNTYYAIIKAVPEMTPYMFGSQMIVYTLVMFIPRAIWPNKPIPPGGDAIRLGISDYALKAGQAYPCIGEYYYEFGIIGVCVFMWLFGYLMNKLRKHYLLNAKSDLDFILYSVMVPTTLQLIIRGYTPSNFYLVVFLLLPIIVIRSLSRVEYKKVRSML